MKKTLISAYEATKLRNKHNRYKLYDAIKGRAEEGLNFLVWRTKNVTKLAKGLLVLKGYKIKPYENDKDEYIEISWE